MSIVIGEGESGSGLLILIVRLHGIFQSTGLTNDRQCSITQTHELTQSTRLEQRWHQKCIAGCIDLMRHLIGIIDAGCHFISVFPCEMTEHILITLLAGSQHHNLYRILTKLIHNTVNQVKSLLIRQSGYNTDHHGFLILRKSKLLLKLQLVLYLFLTEIVHGIILINMFVRLWIPFVIVKTIDNSGQLSGSGTHESIQMFSEERSLDLLCIGTAHRRDPVCIDDASL